MKSAGLALLALFATAGGANAQNEAALRAAFEGRYVTVKIDMPATSQGIDVYPQEQLPVDFREVAQRLKDNGTAVPVGQQVLVTKVVIKGTSHIEFQLGGGGYGTFGDWASSSSESNAVRAEASREEKALEDQIRQTTDRDTKKRLEKERNALRSERERENARAAAEARQANEAREANMRNKRLDSGSRFNIRFRHGMPADAITPDGIMQALASYLDFNGVNGQSNGETAGAETPTAIRSDAAAETGLAALRKGLTLKEVEALLGPALTAAEVKEGAMTVMKRTYVTGGMKIATSFVSGVMIDFLITPQ